jgi:hypothetical protein
MFSLILRNAGFRRTLQPIILQTREFKREVTASDLDLNHPDNPFNKNKKKKKELKENDINKLWVVDSKKEKKFHLDIPIGTYIH